jgi:hypothetical protein
MGALLRNSAGGIMATLGILLVVPGGPPVGQSCS